MFQALLPSAFLLLTYVTGWFLLALIKRDNSIADIAWGLGFVLLACYMQWFFSYEGRGYLTAFVTIWGLRLSSHIFYRNIKTRKEDWRYVQMRQKWGQRQIFMSYFQVFLLQGSLLWIIALPLFIMPVDEWTGLKPFQYVGFAIWLLGFLWESVADWQLYRFKKRSENKGKIMMAGLWQYSRHPNYFGEIILWWGLFCFVAPFGYWWITIISPVTISLLLIYVSGVPMLEAKYKDNLDYQNYIQRTNALIPRFFKNDTK